jgi:cysteine synthase A
MAWYMLTEAEKRGEVHPGMTILELTTGNTGIAFSMLAAAAGYRFIAVMPEHMSLERRQMMRALGAGVVLTPKAEDMPGAKRRYEELRRELGTDVWLPDQFGNEDNPRAHYTYTGESLVRQLKEPVDFFVAGMGTGGTFVGVAQRLRETFPACRMVGVEPLESAVLSGGQAALHGIQGIGEGFVPEIIRRHRAEIDEIATVPTAEAEETARQLALRCGLLAGVSAGANAAVAMRLARQHPGCRVLTLIPDRGERYLNQGLFGCSSADCQSCTRT